MVPGLPLLGLHLGTCGRAAPAMLSCQRLLLFRTDLLSRVLMPYRNIVVRIRCAALAALSWLYVATPQRSRFYLAATAGRALWTRAVCCSGPVAQATL